MAEDLPIYSDSTLRSSLQFAELGKLKGKDTSSVWEKSDGLIALMEGAGNVAAARGAIDELSKDALLRLHSALFQGRSGAGLTRTTALAPIYRGQDCAPPEFIERSLDNLSLWLGAESFREIHPIEACALTIARIADIWPFEYGNLTAAIVFANTFLAKAGLTPFFVQPEHRREFETAVAQSLAIETQPLINAIYRTVLREMQGLGER